MCLVDTSVWIDFFKASWTPAVALLRTLLQSGSEVGLTPSILQGTRDEQQFSRYQDYFRYQIIYLPADPIESAVAAARLYFVCRRLGITVRSSNDCLIAQTTIEHGLSVELVVLARYMQILSAAFVARFPHRIINIHHSFLPACSSAPIPTARRMSGA